MRYNKIVLDRWCWMLINFDTTRFEANTNYKMEFANAGQSMTIHPNIIIANNKLQKLVILHNFFIIRINR